MSKIFKTKNFTDLIRYIILQIVFSLPLVVQANGMGQVVTIGIFMLILFIGFTFFPLFVYVFLRMLLKTSIRRAVFYAIILSIIFLLVVMLFALILEL